MTPYLLLSIICILLGALMLATASHAETAHEEVAQKPRVRHETV